MSQCTNSKKNWNQIRIIWQSIFPILNQFTFLNEDVCQKKTKNVLESHFSELLLSKYLIFCYNIYFKSSKDPKISNAGKVTVYYFIFEINTCNRFKKFKKLTLK